MVKKFLLLRVLSLAIFLILLLWPSAVMADTDTSPTLFEPPAGQEPAGNASQEIFNKYIAAQTFTATVPHDIYHINIFGYIDGEPGYVTLSLVNVTTGNVTTAYPTKKLVYDDNSIWSQKESKVELDDAYFTSEGNGSWIEFEFPRPARVQANQLYAIVVKAPAGTTSANYHWLYQDGGDAYGNGTRWTSIDGGGSWTLGNNTDFMFEVYGRSGMFINTDELTGNLTGVAVFQDVLETNDWLVCVAYENKAPPYYGGDIENYFRLQLWDNDNNSVVGETVLRNWDAAPASLYFNAAEAGDMMWGGNYSVRITATYGGNFYVDEVIQEQNWYGSSLDWLDKWCIANAWWMGVENKNDKEYYVVGTGGGWVLNEYGMTLFNQGIPGLGEARGEYLYESFLVGEGVALPYTGTPDNQLQTKYSWTTQLGATLVDALDDFGTPFNVGGKQVALAVVLALYVATVGGSFPLGHGTAGAVAGFFIILIGMIAGVIDVIWVILAAAIAWIFVLRQLLLVGQ